jgi:hypothetical protein
VRAPNRGVSCRNGQHPDTWTAEGVKGGLIRFYHEIAGVGLLFPRADHPIAIEFPGYPVVRLRPRLELAVSRCFMVCSTRSAPGVTFETAMPANERSLNFDRPHLLEAAPQSGGGPHF